MKMRIELINENEDNDSLLLNKYYKTKIVEDNKEVELGNKELSQKKQIWNLSKMETMIANDETLTNKYNEMAVDGSFKFGYHWNEVIVNLLFNEYVLQDPRYMEKYLNTVAKEKKRRGNPDKKMDSKDFKNFKTKEKEEVKESTMEINENNVKTVRDMNSDEYELISNSQDVASYIEHIGGTEEDYDTLFVKFTADGDLIEVWGMEGTIPYLSNKVYLIYPNGISETTTSGSSGQYSGPAMWAKNKENMRFAKMPMYYGGEITEGISYYESIIDGILNEDRKTSSIINKEKIGRENEANFKSDLKNNNINQIVSGFDNMTLKAIEATDEKSHQDIEDEQVKKMKDFKPVKHENTDEYNKKIQMVRGYGMQDLKYDIEPTEMFKGRAKEDMGEDLYELGQEKIELEKNRPMYNKDTIPTSTEKEFKSKIAESITVTGKYRIGRENHIINFDISDIELRESIDLNDHALINLDGIGNIYNNRATLIESVEKEISDYNFYFNLDDMSIIKLNKNINENNDVNLNNFTRLANYSSFKKMKG